MSPSTGAERLSDRTSELRIVLAISSIGAGLIHAAVVPQHLEEGALFGFFFILAAGFEIAWAIAVLFRPAVIVYAIGALANGATIGIWLVSRTIGLPIGPDPWMPEEIQSLDAAATSLELLLVVGSAVLLRRHSHRGIRGPGLTG